ncbi:MAG: carboxypeptidase-like regulatory domain-containing protein [Chitinophagaceae bacterium]
MGQKFISCLLVLFISITAFTQTGKVAGKVLNEKNEPLAGVSVKIGGAQGGTTTDIEGRFTLTLPVGKKYELTFTVVGYNSKTIDEIEVAKGAVAEVNVLLTVASKDLGAVTVTAGRSSARKESTVSMIQFQKNTSTVAAVVSAETIRRSPDKNTGEVLKRIPGTSVQDGKYLIVRGLADRYNQAMLNGILLSSTEPDRKTFSFDIFPANVIDNIIINKAFVPELPGEWAGGLVQVNTKDIPAANFLNIQAGTGFNSQTIGKDFYSYKGGKLDWLGFDDGTRGLPGSNFPKKTDFGNLTPDQKTAYGQQFKNVWSSDAGSPGLNASFQASGGLNTTLFGKKFGATVALTYNRSVRRLEYENRFFSINGTKADVNFNYNNNKYSQDVLWGALANATLQLNSKNKISFKNILNVNASDYTTRRTGLDYEADPINGQSIRAQELAFRSNIYWNTQLIGDHSISPADIRLHWYGGFNILDQYIPDQRRIQYNQFSGRSDYQLLIANTLSQKTGSRFYSNLNDYIYTAGGDLSKSFDWLGNKQTIKGGYMFQVKDRLFDARPFSVYLPKDNEQLRSLDESTVFSPENFGPEKDNKFGFDEISGNRFRYLANSILNAGFLQFDNQFSDKLRVVWGLRVEDFDQVIGSVKRSDPRHVESRVTDFLPGINITFKTNQSTNLRLSASQTVIRPEFRELSPFAFFDFELGATVVGTPSLQRTKVSNFDLRYEIYPRAGEVITLGVFYKYFKNPIEVFFNQSGVGTSNTFNYLNIEKATDFGAEFEIRKKLDFMPSLRNFTFSGNFSYIYNRVGGSSSIVDRPMQGQSPYVINAALQYDLEKLGINTTLLFNQIGRRILYVGNEQIPAIWENPRPLLDFQIAKKLFKSRGEVRLNIADILNQKAYFYHDLDANKKFSKSQDATAIVRRYGTTFGVTFGYTFK